MHAPGLRFGDRARPQAVGRQRLRERDSRFTGRTPRCGSVCVGSASHASHTSLRHRRVRLRARARRSAPSCRRRSGSSSIWPVRNLTTFPAVVRSKNGRMQSTEFSRSSPGTRRASGLRTIRPSSCVMWVWSFAGRNDTSTSARGQSQPVEIASFATSTRTSVVVLDALRLDPVDLPAAERLCRVLAEHVPHATRGRGPGSRRRSSSSARPTSSGSGVFGICSTSSGSTRPRRLLRLSRTSATARVDRRSFSRRGARAPCRSCRPRPGCRERPCPSQAGLLHADGVDADGWQRAPVLVGVRFVHRLLEPLDRRRDAPARSGSASSRRAVDEPRHDRRLVATSSSC